MLETLKREVCDANLKLVEYGLVILTWGNVSALSEDGKFVVIKPSGVDYSSMCPEQMVVTDLSGTVVEGELRPSSDLLTHLELYRSFAGVGAVVHTHSPYATARAQAELDLPCYGTTHADSFYGAIPCTRHLTKQEVDAELDEVPAHYEVELEDRSGTEYEYRIDAYTGAVLTSYVEPDGHDDADDHDDHDDDYDDDDDDAQPTGQIGHAAAKSAALTHAGVSESRAYDMDVELDDEDGRWVYEVEFKADGMEYEYVIDAYTGAVLEYDMEQDD